jgi:hypothetical protein
MSGNMVGSNNTIEEQDTQFARKLSEPLSVNHMNDAIEDEGNSNTSSNKRGKSLQKSAGKKPKKLYVRILLWILIKSIVPILCVVALLGGLYYGYVVFGHGSPDDVWQWSTWQHMYDLVFSGT